MVFRGGGCGCGSPEPSSWNLPICTKLSSVVILGLVQTTCERNFLDNFLVRSRRGFWWNFSSRSRFCVICSIHMIIEDSALACKTPKHF